MQENVALSENETEKTGFWAVVGTVLVLILFSIWWIGVSVLMYAAFAWFLDHVLGFDLPVWVWLFFI